MQLRVAIKENRAILIMARFSFSLERTINLSLLLDFYHKKGYNVQWVMALDNSDIGMYRDDKVPDKELKQALEKLN